MDVVQGAIALSADAAMPGTKTCCCTATGSAVLSQVTTKAKTVNSPSIARQYPDLRDTLSYLRQDHSMIAHLLAGLQSAVERSASPDELQRHLEGVAAIMESHFRYEERQLLPVLEKFSLDVPPPVALGPL